jgi:hypothetical protein
MPSGLRIPPPYLSGLKAIAPFAERLSTLLNLECLLLAARAMDIGTEHDRVFHDARIFTDVRPVFGPDVSAGAD